MSQTEKGEDEEGHWVTRNAKSQHRSLLYRVKSERETQIQYIKAYTLRYAMLSHFSHVQLYATP